MTHGTVVDMQARVNVVFRLPGQSDIAIEFVVDTGFAGALTLSAVAVAALGLPFFEPVDANLADDSTVRLDAHVARIVWEGVERDVLVLATGRRPLLGTALLRGKRLCADFNDGGTVVVDGVIP